MSTDGGARGARTGSGVEARRAEFGVRCALLDRLERLAGLRARCLEDGCLRPLRLVDFALYSTYRDCVELGLREQARRAVGLPEEGGTG